MKHFTKAGGMSSSLQPNGELYLIPNKKYRLTRQMYLFPKQEVSPQVNDYLKIGAVVTYLKSGELVEDQNVRMPWVYVRSEKQKKANMGKGQEGWCFSHYLQMAEDEEACV
ncbi:MAG: SH3 domain-containing protein [Treponema sp.]|nr:SH3 domain-containing protein [Treponema sp.]